GYYCSSFADTNTGLI
nr:immunoglobulin light chain junction region [Macaca mulatta]